MSRSRRWKVVAVLLGVGAIVSVAGMRLSMERGKGWRLGWRAPWPIRRATPVAEVATHKLRRTLVNQGQVWIDWNNEVQSPYEGDFTIIKLVAEGTKVKKGDIVCELDSTGLQEQLNKRIIVARKAETDFRNLKLAREAIEVALAKLVQGKSPAQDATILGLERELQQKKSDEFAAWSAWDLAESRIRECRQQIAGCVIHAPADGPVVRAKDPHPEAGRFCFEEGATIRHRQRIFSIFDVNAGILVSTKVPEKFIEWVSPGLPARVTLGEFSDITLPGVVLEIMPLPDPSVAGVLRAVYTTRLKIEKGFPGIRPGMEAKVEILLEGLDDVLGVPVQAVMHSDDQDWVALRNADGGFAWREVTVGVPSEAFVEVVHGLQGGDLVALDPIALANGERPSRIRNTVRANPQKRAIPRVL